MWACEFIPEGIYYGWIYYASSFLLLLLNLVCCQTNEFVKGG